MIKVVLIEDELPSVRKLKSFLARLNKKVVIFAEFTTVSETINFFHEGNMPDLIFSDIELLDGNAFEIFEAVILKCPVIFTTAYNQFLMNAFETNGIDYLLKPFSFERFQKAWDKYESLVKTKESQPDLSGLITQILEKQSPKKLYKKRFAVPSSKGTYFINVEDILFFESEGGLVSIIDRQGRKHPLAVVTLKEVELQLDPLDFFRINRSELVNKTHIVRIERYGKNALAIHLSNNNKKLICSQAATPAFKDWVES